MGGTLADGFINHEGSGYRDVEGADFAKDRYFNQLISYTQEHRGDAGIFSANGAGNRIPWPDWPSCIPVPG